MTYLLAWTPLQGKIDVKRFASKEDANTHLGTLPEVFNGVSLDSDTDFGAEISKTILVRLYNGLTGEAINSFSNRTLGTQRVWQVLTTKFNNLPITATHKDIEMNDTTEPVVTELQKKRVKQPVGDFKQVREGSSLGNILRLMDGTRNLVQIAAESGVEGGVFSADDKVKHRIQFVLRVNHGIDNRVDEDGRITAILPNDLTLASVIKAAPVARQKTEKVAKPSAAEKAAAAKVVKEEKAAKAKEARDAKLAAAKEEKDRRAAIAAQAKAAKATEGRMEQAPA